MLPLFVSTPLKAFDTVGHNIFTGRLLAVGFSSDTVGWFTNYLTHRVHTTQLEDATSEVMHIHKAIEHDLGLGQGSLIGGRQSESRPRRSPIRTQSHDRLFIAMLDK